MAEWQSSSGGKIPAAAFQAGNDHAGPMYVARAQHEGDNIPGKVVPANGTAYVAWGDKEHQKDQYEVLCSSNGSKSFWWVPTSSARPVPGSAVVGGSTSCGETLYIGRVKHNGADVCGKVHPSLKKCYISYDGNEHGYEQYDILVLD